MWPERCNPGEQYWANRSEVEFCQLSFGPLVILMGADNEFDFVGIGEVWQVFPAISRCLAAAGAFQVHNAPHTRVERRDVERAAGFNQHGEPIVTKCLHQGNRSGLKQWFATRQFNQRQTDGTQQNGCLAFPSMLTQDTVNTVLR